MCSFVISRGEFSYSAGISHNLWLPHTLVMTTSKERIILFNDAFGTFSLQLHG